MNTTCTMQHVNDVNSDEFADHNLYNLKVIKGICKQSRELQNKLRALSNDKRITVFANQLIVKRDERNGNLRVQNSTINKNDLSITSIPKSNALGSSIVPHYLFLIGILNYGREGNGHAISAIVRNKKLYIFNSANRRSEHSIYRSYGDVISQKSTYRKVYELLSKMLPITSCYVYTGDNLQGKRNFKDVDYSISCTLFSEYFLLHPTLYKHLVPYREYGQTERMPFVSQLKFNDIKFTKQQIFERTKLLPERPKSIGSFNLQFRGLKLREEKRKRSASHKKSHGKRRRYF